MPSRPRPTSRERLEAAAQSFAAQGYFGSSAEVANAVFAVSHALQIPKSVQDLLSYRFQSAEDSYWRNESGGVQEHDLVQAFNSLVAKLKLPAFAETNADQIRMLRLQLAVGSPAFMGRNITKPGMRVGDAIDSAMSPLQALHLVLCLIDQKFYNPVYQVTAEEWPRSKAEYQASLASMGTQYSIRAIPTEKPTLLRQKLDLAFSSMSYSDELDSLRDIERTFGI